MALTPDQARVLADDLYRELDERRPRVTKLNEYYRGRQPLRYASEKWREFHANRYAGFSDNWCAPVADAPAERQRLESIRFSDAGDSPAERALWDVWQRNEGDLQSSQGLLQSGIAGRSFVLVWPGDDVPVVSWESPSQVIVSYDAEFRSRRRAALKSWVDDSTEYSTLYLPDEIWKFQRRIPKVTNGVTESGLLVTSGGVPGAGSWDRREVSGEAWPLRNPLGVVPVVEFPNRPMLGGDPISDISGTVAMQDAINLLWAYLFGAADHASFPGRVVMGQEAPKVPILDAAGQKVGEKTVNIKDMEHGRFLWLTGQNAKIGQWDSAKLDVFTNVIEIAVGHIAAQTRTPPHYLVTNKGLANLSGDALLAAETGLVKKVEEQQLYYTAAVRDVFRLIALSRGDSSAIVSALGGAVVGWKDPAMRSDAQRSDALLKKRQVGYPTQYLIEQDGNDPAEVQRIMRLIEEERQQGAAVDLAFLNREAAADGDAESPATV